VCNDEPESTILVVLPRDDGTDQIQDHARRSVGRLLFLGADLAPYHQHAELAIRSTPCIT
jgi:hypothetical protein